MDSIERYENKLNQTVNTILSLKGVLDTKLNYSNVKIEILHFWLIGFYIYDYESFLQKNMMPYDRKNLQITTYLISEGMISISVEALSLSKKFYLKYPELCQFIPQDFLKPTKLHNPHRLGLKIEILFDKLEIGHFLILCKILSPIKVSFYEICIIQNIWSVAYFQEQVNHFYYEQNGPEIDIEIAIQEMSAKVLNQFGINQ